MLELKHSNLGTTIIGTRHGEKLFEVLVTAEEMMRAEELPGFFRIPADNRDLNYDNYFSKGNPEFGKIEQYTSHNTHRLNVEEMKQLLLKLKLFRRNLLMNVLITGANGFVGKNLTQRLSAIKDHRDRTRPALQIEEILLCTRDTSAETLVGYCQKADFVVHLAGVNRPQDPGEFAAGNTDFTRTLLEMLRESGNRCPVLLSSSIQASLTRTICRKSLWAVQKSGGGAAPRLRQRNRCKRDDLSSAEPVWQVVPPQLQFGGGNLLPSYRAGICRSPFQTRQSNWNWSTLTT